PGAPYQLQRTRAWPARAALPEVSGAAGVKPWIYHPPDPPPDGCAWVDALRWLVAVMDGDDRSLLFVAGCLRYALEHNGCLTSKQADACNRILTRILDRWHEGTLACQLAVDHPLRNVQPRGNA